MIDNYLMMKDGILNKFTRWRENNLNYKFEEDDFWGLEWMERIFGGYDHQIFNLGVQKVPKRTKSVTGD